MKFWVQTNHYIEAPDEVKAKIALAKWLEDHSYTSTEKTRFFNATGLNFGWPEREEEIIRYGD